jgi:hypothetical protein
MLVRIKVVIFTLIVTSAIPLIGVTSSFFSITLDQQHKAFALCPSGTRQSPQGICQVPQPGVSNCPSGTRQSPQGICQVPQPGVSNCPNGFYKGTTGNCEPVNNNGSSAITTKGNSKSNNNNESLSKTVKGSNNNNNNQSSSPTKSSAASTITTDKGCDQTLWKHVYKPQRLQLIDSCKTVSGLIESKRAEADGSLQMRLKLDPQFSDLLNKANIKGQQGDMIVEAICITPVTQRDAISACRNFHPNISIPPVDTHVKVTGSYVLNKEHDDQAEIHPVTSILSNKMR